MVIVFMVIIIILFLLVVLLCTTTAITGGNEGFSESQAKHDLLDKCIAIINDSPLNVKKIKRRMPATTVDEINEFLHKYHHRHTYLHSHTEMRNRDIDKLPEIHVADGITYIKFFSIQGSFTDRIDGVPGASETSYATNTKYGRRCVEIVNMTRSAINAADMLDIDFTECGGGDLKVFVDAFSPLMGTGMLFRNDIRATYYDGHVTTVSDKFDVMARIKATQPKRIVIHIDENSRSSAELIPMIIRNSYPDTVFDGARSGGYMTDTNDLTFDWKGEQYQIAITIVSPIYDSDGVRYDGFITGKKSTRLPIMTFQPDEYEMRREALKKGTTAATRVGTEYGKYKIGHVYRTDPAIGHDVIVTRIDELKDISEHPSYAKMDKNDIAELRRYQAKGIQYITIKSTNPHGSPSECKYNYHDDGRVRIIEITNKDGVISRDIPQ